MLLFTLLLDKMSARVENWNIVKKIIATTSDERYPTCVGASGNFIVLNTDKKHSFLLIYNFLLVSAPVIWSREPQFKLLCQLDEQIGLKLYKFMLILG